MGGIEKSRGNIDSLERAVRESGAMIRRDVFLKALMRHGIEYVRHSGNHIVMRNPQNQATAKIAINNNRHKDLPKKYMLNVISSLKRA